MSISKQCVLYNVSYPNDLNVHLLHVKIVGLQS